MNSVGDSSSFSFLAPYGPLYLRLATVAEQALAVDPSLTLVSLRQLAEAFAKYAAAKAGLLGDARGPQLAQVDLLRTLEQRGIVQVDPTTRPWHGCLCSQLDRLGQVSEVPSVLDPSPRDI